MLALTARPATLCPQSSSPNCAHIQCTQITTPPKPRSAAKSTPRAAHSCLSWMSHTSTPVRQHMPRSGFTHLLHNCPSVFFVCDDVPMRDAHQRPSLCAERLPASLHQPMIGHWRSRTSPLASAESLAGWVSALVHPRQDDGGEQEKNTGHHLSNLPDTGLRCAYIGGGRRHGHNARRWLHLKVPEKRTSPRCNHRESTFTAVAHRHISLHRNKCCHWRWLPFRRWCGQSHQPTQQSDQPSPQRNQLKILSPARMCPTPTPTRFTSSLAATSAQVDLNSTEPSVKRSPMPSPCRMLPCSIPCPALPSWELCAKRVPLYMSGLQRFLIWPADTVKGPLWPPEGPMRSLTCRTRQASTATRVPMLVPT